MIYFGDRFRVSRDSHSWKLEERTVKKKDDTESWGTPKYYATIRGILDAIIEASAKNASAREEALTMRQALDIWRTNLLAAMDYFFVLHELALPELQGLWQALEIEGVPARIVDVTDEQLEAVKLTFSADEDVARIVDLEQNARGMMKLLGGLQ